MPASNGGTARMGDPVAVVCAVAVGTIVFLGLIVAADKAGWLDK